MAVDLEELRKTVARMSDEQLFVMATWQRNDYRPEALDLAEAEILRRGLVLPASTASLATNSQSVAVQRLNLAEKGCLAILGLFIAFSLSTEFIGFARWFWPGLFEWLFVSFSLAGMFGALGWLLGKLRR